MNKKIKEFYYFLASLVIVGSIGGLFSIYHDHQLRLEEQNMTKISSGKHFLPEYESEGYKKLSDILGDFKQHTMGYVTNSNGSVGRLANNTKYEANKERKSPKDLFNYTVMTLPVDNSHHYTEIKFSTQMDFDKNLVSINQSTFPRYKKIQPAKLFQKDLVGLCVIHDEKDVTDKGSLKIEDDLITWQMNDSELKEINENTSDDIFYFFIFQTKPKATIN